VLATPAAAPGTVLLSDNFDDPANGKLTAANYVGGQYRLRVTTAGMTSLSNPSSAVPGTYGDVSIAVDAQMPPNQPTPYAIHVACRVQEGAAAAQGAGYYLLAVDPVQGRVSMFLRKDGRLVEGAFPTRQESPAVRRGGESNRIELSCVGDTLTAAVNGQQVLSVRDTTFRAGRAQIGFEHGVGLGAEARFDNLVLTQR
jgi:hypothetical protein